jgi:hypothetical protein
MSALLLAILAASPAAPLNTEGFKLYQAGKYPEALEKFRAAVTADEAHALSHYNLAATLGLLRGQGKVCEFDAYQPTILEHLERAVQLDEGRRKRMQRDKDFDSVRGTLRYQQLLGRSATREKDVKPLVTALTWYTPAVGAYGNPEVLRFTVRGTFTLSRMEMEGDEPRRVSTRGRFTVKGFEVTLTFDQPVAGVKSAKGLLGADGHLVFTAPAWNFSDTPSECDA